MTQTMERSLQVRRLVATECTDAVVNRIVSIHMESFTGFFLTFLGCGFLKHLYQGYCEHPQSGLFVAEESGEIVGFLAYSEDLSGLYKMLIRTRLIPFAWYSFLAFLRRPGVFFRLLRAFLKPGESERNEAYVELASIGVLPDGKGKGVGSRLIDALKNRTDFSHFAYITLETDAVDNDGANAFYVKNGFTLFRTYMTHEGRKMNEYRFYHQ